MDSADKNILIKIKEMAKLHPERFRVVEAQIDIAVQLEYFDRLSVLRKQAHNADIEILSKTIFNIDSSEQEIKDALILLASIAEPKAYRSIEKYLETPESKYKDWAMLAYHASRLLLEMSLLDESLVFISSGLGGKQHKLRYSIVLLKNDKSEFVDFQHKIIKNEIEAGLEPVDSELEDLQICEGFIQILCLMPLYINLKIVFENIVSEINNYGVGLRSHVMITNEGIISKEDIQKNL